MALDGLGQTLNIIGPMLSGNGVTFDQHNRLVPRSGPLPTQHHEDLLTWLLLT